jgi:Zn-dependent protease with chaperone function
MPHPAGIRAPAVSDATSRRAALAVALWGGFYLLSFGVAGGLTMGAWALAKSNLGIHPLTTAMCVTLALAGSAIILWSSLPRWERFRAPGPRLDPGSHPRLFEAIHGVARETRQKPPTEVFLILDVNAWVSQRGGLMGLFSRRVMGIGLPLLHTVTLTQFRSVLAHEFGHYVAGDTRMGPWVHRTHAAIHRTLDALEGSDSIWRFPFIAYARLFMRIAMDVSRRQEYAADALAARIAGRVACAGALRRIEASAAAFPAYRDGVLLPVLQSGRLPQVCEGFSRFLASRDISRQVRQYMGRTMARRTLDPAGTHPPLPDRIEALGVLPPDTGAGADPPAISLLTDPEVQERRLLCIATGIPAVDRYPAVTWDEVGECVYLPHWREQAGKLHAHAAGITPLSFPTLPLTAIGRRIDTRARDAAARAAAMDALGLLLMVSLSARGWSVRMEPGERPAAMRDGLRVEPFHVFMDIAEGTLTPESWCAQCVAGGFGDVDLGAAP